MSGVNDTTFLLAEKVVFDVTNAQLASESGEKVVKLDPLEQAVLKDLVMNQGQLVPYDELFRHWSSRYVSDGVLARVISSLRSKFKLFEDVEISIKNRPKQGYMLVANVLRRDPIIKNTSPLLKIGLAICFPLLAVVFSVFYMSSDKSAEFTIQLDYKPLISSPHSKDGLAFNPSYSHLSYSSFNKKSKLHQISIINLVDGSTYNYQEEYNLHSPEWIDEKRMIFRSKSKDYCRIRIAELDAEQRIINTMDAVECNPKSYWGDIAMLSNNYVLYTDSTTPFGPAQLFTLNLTTFKSTHIPFKGLLAAGIYKIVVAQDSDLIALLINNDYKSTEIRLINLKADDLNVASLTTNVLNFSVGWDGKTLVAKGESGSLEFYELNGDELENTHSYPVFGIFKDVVNIPNGVAFELGDIYSDQLFVKKHGNQVVQQITNLVGSDASNAYYNSGEVFFSTNDTGINQIRRLTLNTGNFVQLSNFPKDKVINSLTVNPSNKHLALETMRGIELYSLGNESNTFSDKIEFAGILPNLTDTELFYAKVDNSTVNLFRYDLLAKKSFLVKEGAALGSRFNDDIIFAFDKRPGIWKLVDGKPELVVDTNGEVFELLVKGNEIHFRDSRNKFFIFNGHNVNQRSKAPQGYRVADTGPDLMILTKSTPNRTQVVALQKTSVRAE